MWYQGSLTHESHSSIQHWSLRPCSCSLNGAKASFWTLTFSPIFWRLAWIRIAARSASSQSARTVIVMGAAPAPPEKPASLSLSAAFFRSVL